MTVLTAPKSSLVDDGIAKPGDSPISGTAESFEGCPGVIWSTSHIFVSTHFLPFHISAFLQVEHSCLLVFGLLLSSLYFLSSYTRAIVLILPRLTAMSASGSGAPNAPSGSSKKAFPSVDLQGNDLPPSPAPSSPHGGRRYNIATELVFTEGNDQYNASSVPIYQVRKEMCNPALQFICIVPIMLKILISSVAIERHF